MARSDSCKDCKHLAKIPFAGYLCENEDSDYYLCDCDPKEDLCKDFEKEKK